MTNFLYVLFRKDKDGEITAVFPTELGGSQYMDMTCYSHVGQHSSCDDGWYGSTVPAALAEYADLLTELRQIYEQDEDAPVRLIVRHKITAAMTDERRRQQDRQR